MERLVPTESAVAEMNVARPWINRNFVDPGSRAAHNARGTAAVAIHGGALAHEAVEIAIGHERAFGSPA